MARCVVCGSEGTARPRTVLREFGGDGTELSIRVTYCADDPRCGEAEAVKMIELLAAPFIAADVRRDGVSSIEDLSEPDH